ncbi:MAG: DUF488 domain-containing protein [Vulcanimicrobiaceae bacterium]
MELLTIGHGTASQDELADRIRDADIARVADVRTVPKSRRHPHVWREQLEQWIPAQAGAAYEWVPDLGGFRRVRPDSPNIALRNASFRGYADYMETERFQDALRTLMDTAARERTAVMCSETLWWRCHRRLISDAAVLLYGADVRHLDANGRLREHILTEGVRRVGDHLRYDGGTS